MSVASVNSRPALVKAKSWNRVPIDDVAVRGSGHTPDKKHPEYWGGDIQWVSLKDTFRLDVGLVVETTDTITADGLAHSSAVMHPRGSVILLRDAGIGKSAILGADMAVSQHFMAWRCGPRLDNWFLYYYFQQMKPEFERISNGSTIKTIGLDYFKQLTVPLPSIGEQYAIAQMLREADDLITTLERLIAKKESIKQGMMQQLLTGKTRLPGFVKEWTETTIGDLENKGKLKLYRGKVISKRDIAALPGPYPIYSSSVHNQGLFGTYGRYMFDEELITWSVDGGGHFFYRPRHRFSVTNVCGYMRVTSKSIDPQFLTYHLQALHSRLHFDYTLKAHPSVIRGAYQLTLPGPDEQRAIAQALTDCDDEINVLRVRLTKAKAIKQGMMQELLTGSTRLPVAEAAS